MLTCKRLFTATTNAPMNITKEIAYFYLRLRRFFRRRTAVTVMRAIKKNMNNYIIWNKAIIFFLFAKYVEI